MIGKKLTRKADKSVWTVAAYDEGQNEYVLTPQEFGPNLALSSPDLRAEFQNVRLTEPGATDEVSAWRKFGESVDRGTGRRRSTINGTMTVEDVFAGKAAQKAQEIAASPDALADYAVGLLPVSPAVAEHLDALLSEAEQSEPIA